MESQVRHLKQNMESMRDDLRKTQELLTAKKRELDSVLKLNEDMRRENSRLLNQLHGLENEIDTQRGSFFDAKEQIQQL